MLQMYVGRADHWKKGWTYGVETGLCSPPLPLPCCTRGHSLPPAQVSPTELMTRLAQGLAL